MLNNVLDQMVVLVVTVERDPTQQNAVERIQIDSLTIRENTIVVTIPFWLTLEVVKLFRLIDD